MSADDPGRSPGSNAEGACEVDALDQTYRTNLPGVFMHEAFSRWPALLAEVRRLQAELRACRDARARSE
jgi:hypothetical protein